MYIFIDHARKTAAATTAERANNKATSTSKEGGGGGADNNIAAQTFTFRELAAATKNFRQEYLLGEGGFGRVYKGRLDKTDQVNIHNFLIFFLNFLPFLV